MKAARPRFSIAVHLYLATFFVLLGTLPVIHPATLERGTALPGRWIASLLWPLAIAALWHFADRRCSSPAMRYRDGLLWIAASMMTGWIYMSFVLVLPVLLLAFAGSVFIALYGAIQRAPTVSQTQWVRLVRFFYRNRMFQP